MPHLSNFNRKSNSYTHSGFLPSVPPRNINALDVSNKIKYSTFNHILLFLIDQITIIHPITVFPVHAKIPNPKVYIWKVCILNLTHSNTATCYWYVANTTQVHPTLYLLPANSTYTYPHNYFSFLVLCWFWFPCAFGLIFYFRSLLMSPPLRYVISSKFNCN